MKTLIFFGLLFFSFTCSAQNVGIGTASPAHKLDIYGNIGLSGRQAVSDGNDGWLRLNQAGSYTNGIYTPGFLRVDGGISSGAAASLGSGTIAATGQITAPIFYDMNNTAYYLDPASTSNLNVLRFNTCDCLNGTCPPNSVIRYTPNFHINTPAGNSLIINWDNGTTSGANVQQFRVGTGQGADAFYVTSGGDVTAHGNITASGQVNGNSIISNSSIVVDNGNLNTGSIASGLAFGNASGEGIGSKRSAGGNQYGLDFYTGFTPRLTLTNAGRLGIGITTPSYLLSVQEPNIGAAATYSTNTYSGNFDGKGLYGRSVNSPGYGYGGYFEGGYMGAQAYCYGSTYTGTVYGLYGEADGSAGVRIGVYGITGASGTATGYGVYCVGNGTYTGTWTGPSDAMLKTDITDYHGALSKLLQLTPKRYFFKSREYDFMQLPKGQQVGLIAQDVEKIFPELVENNINPGPGKWSDHNTGKEIRYKSMNYIMLTPILVQAIKEQEQVIEELKTAAKQNSEDIRIMKEEIAQMKAAGRNKGN